MYIQYYFNFISFYLANFTYFYVTILIIHKSIPSLVIFTFHCVKIEVILILKIIIIPFAFHLSRFIIQLFGFLGIFLQLLCYLPIFIKLVLLLVFYFSKETTFFKEIILYSNLNFHFILLQFTFNFIRQLRLIDLLLLITLFINHPMHLPHNYNLKQHLTSLIHI